MAGDRTVKVSLTASVSQYISEFAKAKAATSDVADSAQAAQKKLEDQQGAMTKLGVGALAFGAIAAAGVALAVSKYAEFQQAMSEVQAATHESAANMQLLSDAALQAGADTVYSATEAANAEAELAKAGLSTAQILGGALDGALSLASAGSLDVADAAQIAATALTQFKLKGSDVPHVADLLAAGAGKAQGSVQDLSMALNQGGLVASQAGQSIEETTGTLAAFASAGLIGSDAGTSLKTMLLALESPSSQAKKVMDQYGISVYDSSGKMLDFSGVANVLQNKLGSLTQEQRNAALSTIFGNDAIRSASILYDQGASGIDDWTAKVNDSGYAAETARLKLDNLNGDIEYLSGSIDTALIKSGSAANDMLRGLIQTVTGLVNAFSAAPQWVQTSALALAALAAAVSLAAGAFLLGVPAVANFAAALTTLAASEIPAVAGAAAALTSTIGGTGAALKAVGTFMTGPWGIALAAAATAVVVLSKVIDGAQASSEQLTNTLTTAKTAVDIFKTAAQGENVKFLFSDATKDLGNLQDVLNAADDQAKNLFARFDSSHFAAFDALKKIGTQLGTMAQTDLPNAEKAFSLLVAQTDGTDRSIQILLDQMPDYKAALVQQATKLGETADATTLLALAQEGGVPATQDAAAAYSDASSQVSDLNKEITDLMTSIDAANSTGQDAVSANAAYQQSISDLNDQMAKIAAGTDGYKATLDLTTQAGRDNSAMLTDLAKTGEDAAAKQFALDGNTQNYRATLEATHQSIYDHAVALGLSGDDAAALADNIARIPSDTEWQVIANTASAEAKVNAFLTATQNRRITVEIDGIVVDKGITKANGGIIPHMAGGSPTWYKDGVVRGSGGPRDDKVPARLSPGEFVVNAAATARNLSLLNAINSGQDSAPSSYAGTSSVGSAAVPVINVNSQIVDTNGTFIGTIYGVVGEQLNVAFATQSSQQAAGYRREQG